MSITVKELIKRLQEIDNMFLEVEVVLVDKDSLEPGIQSVRRANRKVLIFLERKK